MARIETIERIFYQFGELSDDAKEQARGWYRGCIESDELESDGDDWDTIASILGVEFATHSVKLYGGGTRQEATIYWTLDPNSCAFSGSYSYAKAAPASIRAHAPNDLELHRIADMLQSVQRANFYRIEAVCMATGHSGTNQKVTCERSDYVDLRIADEVAVESLLTDFASWIVSQIEAQRDYLYSDEAVDESILANGYEFTESGSIA